MNVSWDFSGFTYVKVSFKSFTFFIKKREREIPQSMPLSIYAASTLLLELFYQHEYIVCSVLTFFISHSLVRVLSCENNVNCSHWF
jgi:hypothetical protein